MQASSLFLYFIGSIIQLLEMVCGYVREYDMCHGLSGLISLLVLNTFKELFHTFGPLWYPLLC